MLDLTEKIVLAHRGFFNATCVQQYREHSLEVVREAVSREYVDIIELDLRKSADGVLYCYHGNFWEYYFHLHIPRKFSAIRDRYHVYTLTEILQVISSEKSVFLDLKSKSITKEDILAAFNGKSFKEVILGNKSVRFLDRFMDMPHHFVKILNGNIFCNFYNLARLRSKHYKYIEVVFPFQIRNKIVERVRRAGLELRVSGLFFLSQRHYAHVISAYNIKHVSGEFIDAI